MLHLIGYWPVRLSLESSAILDWNNCPYVTYDFDDHYDEVDVPLLAFTSQLFGLNYWGPFRHGIANPDFTGIYLWGYGHLDVYSGEHSEANVSKPTYEWLMNRRMLESFGRIGRCGDLNEGSATIFINDKYIYFKAGDQALLFNIDYQKSHRNYDLYVGSNNYGEIKVQISKRNSFAVATGKHIHFFGYEV